MRLGAVAFIIPFIFVYGNALLLAGSALEILLAAITAIIGTYCLAVGLEGWFAGYNLNILSRIVILGGALTSIVPGVMSDLIGLGCIVLFLLIHKGTREKIFRRVKAQRN
jgi:TRAP-type uncharacterized transport system fused permease subunit